MTNKQSRKRPDAPQARRSALWHCRSNCRWSSHGQSTNVWPAGMWQCGWGSTWCSPSHQSGCNTLNTELVSSFHRTETFWEQKFRWAAGEIPSPFVRLRKQTTVFKKFDRKAGPRNWFTELFSGHSGFEDGRLCELSVLRVLQHFPHFSRKTSRFCR